MTNLDLTSATEAAAIALHDRYCPAGRDCREPSTSLGNWHDRAAVAVEAAAPILLAHIEELEHAVERLAGVPLADASPQLREWLATDVPPVAEGKPDDLAELRRRMDEATPGAVAELRAEAERLTAELDLIARQRQTVLDACTRADREAVTVGEIHQAFITDPADEVQPC